MLNPFAIEKELFAKTDAISNMLDHLKGLISISVERKMMKGNVFHSPIIAKCLEMREAEDNNRKLYACKVCGKNFNQGRKLGGHVSRAHKGSSQVFLPSEDSGTEIYRPRVLRLFTASRGANSHSGSLMEEQSDSEIYIPRASRFRSRPLTDIMEDETCAKKLKVEDIFYDD